MSPEVSQLILQSALVVLTHGLTGACALLEYYQGCRKSSTGL